MGTSRASAPGSGLDYSTLLFLGGPLAEMRCRAAPPGLMEGPRRPRSCLQTTLWSARARRARALRAFPFVHCATGGTRKRLPARLKAAPWRPRRRNAPASQRCTHGNGTRGSPRWQLLFSKRAGVLTHVYTKIPPRSFRTRTRHGELETRLCGRLGAGCAGLRARTIQQELRTYHWVELDSSSQRCAIAVT